MPAPIRIKVGRRGNAGEQGDVRPKQAFPYPASTFGRRDTSEHVVAVGLQALERDRGSVITTARDYLKAQGARFLPRGVIPRFLERVLRAGDAQ